MNMDHWTIFKDSMTMLVAGVAAIIAAIGYSTNAKTRRAEFLCGLHKSFFEDSTYKQVRKTLDDDSEMSGIARANYVVDEPEEFTDFLNFFELVAYLQKIGNLSGEDVKALLGYYTGLIKKDTKIREYVRNPKNGFEQLNRLLDII